MASANNYHDTDVNWSFKPNVTYMTNQARKKEDTSYSYQKCYTTSHSYESWVFGVNAGGSPVDMSRGNHYTFTAGKAWWMLNWVKESGYNYAGMYGKSTGTHTATAKWSPDSI